MHMGSLASIVDMNCPNYIYILLNNGVHDSVGGQKIGAHKIDFCVIAKGCGFKKILSIKNKDQLNKIKNIQSFRGPIFIEIFIKPGFKKDLMRPNSTPKENKELFLRSLGI